MSYEQHLRTAHGGLDIVLTSTVQYINMESSVSHNPDASGRQDCDYAPDPGPPGSDPNPFYRDIAYESDTEVVDEATSPSACKQIPYEGAREATADVHQFEHQYSNLCEDPLAPFNSPQGFKLASWFIEGKVSKSRINQYFSSGLGDAESVGYTSMHTLENHLQLLDPNSQYLQLFEGQVEDGQRTLPFFYRNVLCCVRYLILRIACRDDLVYAPRHEYYSTGQRIHAEMHRGDWWWDVQAQHPSPKLFWKTLADG